MLIMIAMAMEQESLCFPALLGKHAFLITRIAMILMPTQNLVKSTILVLPVVHQFRVMIRQEIAGILMIMIAMELHKQADMAILMVLVRFMYIYPLITVTILINFRDMHLLKQKDYAVEVPYTLSLQVSVEGTVNLVITNARLANYGSVPRVHHSLKLAAKIIMNI